MIRTVLKIDGMMCGMCESHMNDTIRQNFKIKKVNSSAKKGETEIISEEPLDEDKIKAEVEKIGYKVMGVEKRSMRRSFHFFQNRVRRRY